MKGKYPLIIVIIVMMIITVACDLIASGPSAAEQTLEAMYIEQTIAALNAENNQKTIEAQVALNVQQTMDAQPKEIVVTAPPPTEIPPTPIPPTEAPPTETPIPEPTATQPIIHMIYPRRTRMDSSMVARH